MEIIKKYLVREIPDLNNWKKQHIEYYYINFDPEIRIKKTNEDYSLIVKNTKLNENIEISISIEEFEKLKIIAGGCRLIMDSYSNVLDGNNCKLDIYENIEDLAITEIKFNGIRESVRFTNPEWFGEDITSNTSFQKSSLATHQCFNA